MFQLGVGGPREHSTCYMMRNSTTSAVSFMLQFCYGFPSQKETPNSSDELQLYQAIISSSLTKVSTSTSVSAMISLRVIG